MKQYRAFHRRIGKRITEFDNVILIRDPEHAFELYKYNTGNYLDYKEPKETKDVKKIKEGLEYAKKHLKKVFQELEKED